MLQLSKRIHLHSYHFIFLKAKKGNKDTAQIYSFIQANQRRVTVTVERKEQNRSIYCLSVIVQTRTISCRMQIDSPWQPFPAKLDKPFGGTFVVLRITVSGIDAFITPMLSLSKFSGCNFSTE